MRERKRTSPSDDPELKRQRERARRAKFTPEQKKQASDYSKLYLQHRRLTDEKHLAVVRARTREQHAKHRSKRRIYINARTFEMRLRCLVAYSKEAFPACVCCGETILEFLTLDHIKDKRTDGGVRLGGKLAGYRLYLWLVRMNFPAGLQVLCFNCNCGRSIMPDHRCPHERERDIEQMVS